MNESTVLQDKSSNDFTLLQGYAKVEHNQQDIFVLVVTSTSVLK